MTEVYVRHQSAETRQSVAALTRAATTRPNVTLRLPGAATPTSLWHVPHSAHDGPKSP